MESPEEIAEWLFHQFRFAGGFIQGSITHRRGFMGLKSEAIYGF